MKAPVRPDMVFVGAELTKGTGVTVSSLYRWFNKDDMFLGHLRLGPGEVGACEMKDTVSYDLLVEVI